MAGFIKFVFIFILSFYIIRMLLRLLLPVALRKMAEKLMKNAKEGSGSFNTFQGGFSYQDAREHQQNNRRRDQGKVSVDYIPPKESKKKRNDSAGEVIDFEEIT